MHSLHLRPQEDRGLSILGGAGYRDQMAFSIDMNSATSLDYVIGGYSGYRVWVLQTSMEFLKPDPIPDALRSVITESRSILDLGDNWDGEGSPGYSEATWQRAVNFLIAQWTQFLLEVGHPMEIPTVLPDANGSIDLWWDTDEFQLLVSIPGSELLPASYYGHKHQEQKIQYAFDTSKADRRLVQWMAKVEGSSPSPTTSPPPI